MKPILFNTEMVKAILNGRKTMTRRVIKGISDKYYNEDIEVNPYVTYEYESGKEKQMSGTYAWFFHREYEPEFTELVKSRHEVGDILYVREAWWKTNDRYYYLADYDLPELVKKQLSKSSKCRPSIHMPKEAARIFLRVTNVRVERLQDISFLDALNEGISPQITEYDGRLEHPEIAEAYRISCIDAFHKLWDSTIKKSELDRYGWNANPWVFVYQFDRCEKPVREVNNELETK